MTVTILEDYKKKLTQRERKMEEDATFALEWFSQVTTSQEERVRLTEEYLAKMDEYHKTCGVEGVQKFIPIEVLKKGVDWDNMDEEAKRKLLWNLGMNTKAYKTHYIERLYRKGTKIAMEEGIWGLERLDQKWTKMRDEFGRCYASLEACNMSHKLRHGKGAGI